MNSEQYQLLPNGAYREVGGVETWMVESGEGNPVVLVYGGSFGGSYAANGAYSWSRQFDYFRNAYRVVAYDKPAQGWSGRPTGLGDYSMASVVNHLLKLLEALQPVVPVHLVGHSRGGYIACRAALLRPDLVRSLTLVNSGTLSPGVGTNEVVLAGCPYEPSQDSVRWTYGSYLFDPKNLADDFVNEGWKVLQSERYRSALLEIEQNELMAGQFLPQLARDKRDTLIRLADGELQRPTQIIWGRDDKTALLARGLGLFDLLRKNNPDTRMSIVNRCGHFPHWEHAAWFNETVGGFMAEVNGD